MKINTKYLAMCIFCIFLFSCSAEKHLAIAKRKKPELFQKDTIRVVDSGSVELKPTDSLALNQLDSLLEALMDCGDSKENLRTETDSAKNAHTGVVNKNLTTQKRYIKNQVLDIHKNKPCIKPGDTLEYAAEGIIFKVWQDGNRLKFAHEKTFVTEKAVIVEEKKKDEWVWPVIICMAAFIGLLLLLIRR